jgi:succinate dehydrogenase hydrophobic anchor subunit
MRESTLWLLHLSAAIVLVVTVTIHLASFTSFIGPGRTEALEFPVVKSRVTNPLYTIVYVLFLAAGFYHGVYGVRTILSELIPNKAVRKALVVLVAVAGVLFFLWGTYTVMVGLTL